MIKTARIAPLLILTLLAATLAHASTYAAFSPTKPPTWARPINGWVQFASPAFGDLDGDGKQEIVVGSNGRQVYAFHDDGSAVSGWPVSVSAAVGSAPAIGDITGDGLSEVVVTVGTSSDVANPGGIYAFRSNGQLLWRRDTQDVNGGPNGAGDGVFASPVLVDLDNDGRLDVLTASFDERVYAYHGDGSPVAGWPFLLGDGSWATPAVGDVDGDGGVDVAITAATNSYVRGFGPAWSGALSACRRDPNDASTERACGVVLLLNASGELKPGWPKFIAGQTYDASPALADLDGDSRLEIITGNGDSPGFNDLTQPFYVTAWRADGSMMWRRATGDFVFGGAPAVGDIDGDGRPEVVVGSNDRSIYAYNHDGSNVSGFPKPLLDAQGNNAPANQPPVLADVNSDGKPDIVVAAGWDLMAISGTGSYLTSNLVLYTNYSLGSAPAIGDIDNDGKLEIAIGSAQNPNQNDGRLLKWDLDVGAAGLAIPWPQFHGSAHHTGLFAVPALRATTADVTLLVRQNSARSIAIGIADVAGGDLAWTASADQPWVQLNPGGGGTPGSLTIRLSAAGKAPGSYNGVVTLSSPAGDLPIAVRMIVAADVSDLYLPLVRR